MEYPDDLGPVQITCLHNQIDIDPGYSSPDGVAFLRFWQLCEVRYKSNSEICFSD